MEQQLITLCKTFAHKADELEIKAFNNPDYRENGFVSDFNELFDSFCYGKQNRTVSGLNFRNPPRYENIKSAVKEEVIQRSVKQYQITFEGLPKFRSIRFIAEKKSGDWRLIRFETYIGISNHPKDKGEELWRRNKL